MEIDQHIETGARPVDIHSPTGNLEDPDFEIRQKTGYLTKRGENVKVKCNMRDSFVSDPLITDPPFFLPY